MSQATGGAGTWWIEAFPHWEPIADHVPVGPREAVHLTSPEDRVETVLEIASEYRSVRDFSLGELYPLVPARFPLRVSAESKPTTFAAVASVAAVDILPIRSRQAVREIHLTLAQANAAAASSGAINWPSDDVLSAVGSAIFSLYPTDFYALIDVAIGGRDHAVVETYAARDLDVTDVGAFIRAARLAGIHPRRDAHGRGLDLRSPRLHRSPDCRCPHGIASPVVAEDPAPPGDVDGDRRGDRPGTRPGRRRACVIPRRICPRRPVRPRSRDPRMGSPEPQRDPDGYQPGVRPSRRGHQSRAS